MGKVGGRRGRPDRFLGAVGERAEGSRVVQGAPLVSRPSARENARSHHMALHDILWLALGGLLGTGVATVVVLRLECLRRDGATSKSNYGDR
jgi:hypothetical protein